MPRHGPARPSPSSNVAALLHFVNRRPYMTVRGPFGAQGRVRIAPEQRFWRKRLRRCKTSRNWLRIVADGVLADNDLLRHYDPPHDPAWERDDFEQALIELVATGRDRDLRICPGCRRDFLADHDAQEYCSTRCRQKFYQRTYQARTTSKRKIPRR